MKDNWPEDNGSNQMSVDGTKPTSEQQRMDAGGSLKTFIGRSRDFSGATGRRRHGERLGEMKNRGGR